MSSLIGQMMEMMCVYDLEEILYSASGTEDGDATV